MLPRIEPIIPSKDGVYAVMADPHAYVYELKFDGFRCVAYKNGKDIELSTKFQNKFTGFHDLRKELAALPEYSLILDGEIICLNEHGQPDFNALMHRCEPQLYYVFDVLFKNGEDMRQRPLSSRKERLQKLLPDSSGLVRMVQSFPSANTSNLIAHVREKDLEGVIAKLADASYDPRLPNNWVKIVNPDYSQYRNRWRWFKDRG